MKFISLFSGIGGFDLGLERAGMTCIAQVEKDAKAFSVLQRRWPKVKRFDDVSTFKKTRGMRADLICGGFPCQDLSVAGKRAGLAGERSGLFFEFMRIVGDFAPAWVLIENVPGLLSSNKGRDMSTVVGSLAERGYGWAYRVLDTQYFGCAQRRERVFIVGNLGDARRAAEVLFESENLPWNPPPRREKREGVAGSLSPSLSASGRGTSRSGESRGQDCVIPVSVCMGSDPISSSDLAQPITTRNGDPGTIAFCLNGKNGKRFDGESEKFVTHTPKSEGADASEDGTGRGVPLVCFDTTQITSKANYSQPKPGQPCHPLASGSHPPAIAYAIQERAVEKSGVRRLTPLECERLQGFPDEWTDNLSDSARYRVLGNAVSVPVAEWIGKRMMRTIE